MGWWAVGWMPPRDCFCFPFSLRFSTLLFSPFLFPSFLLSTILSFSTFLFQPFFFSSVSPPTTQPGSAIYVCCMQCISPVTSLYKSAINCLSVVSLSFFYCIHMVPSRPIGTRSHPIPLHCTRRLTRTADTHMIRSAIGPYAYLIRTRA